MDRLKKIARLNGHSFEEQEGGNHTKVTIGDWKQPIPRHREIDERLARAIISRAEQHFGKEGQ